MSRTSIAVRFHYIFFFILLIAVASTSNTAFAEDSPATAITTPPPAPAPAATRQAAIEQQQAAKVETLQPVALGKGEHAINLDDAAWRRSKNELAGVGLVAIEDKAWR